MFERLLTLWRHSQNLEIRDAAALSMGSQPLGVRKAVGWFAATPHSELKSIVDGYQKASKMSDQVAALVSAWYMQACSDHDIFINAVELWQRRIEMDIGQAQAISDILDRLGGKPEFL